MRPKPIIYCGLLLAIISVSLIAQKSSGQSSAARSLITQPVDDTKLVVLRGNTYPLARAKYDQGPAPASLPEDRMVLVLKRSPEQQAAADLLLAQQADKTSPNYHKWLTPEQFGERFGVSDADLQKVTDWLQSHGFASIKPAIGRDVIEFSGNAGQVQSAFHTTIHSYLVNGRQHWANSSDPSIPQALAPVVAGVASLHNFTKKPMHHFAGNFRKSPQTGKVEARNAVRPEFTFTGSNGVYYAVAPYDFATIYNVTPLWNASITGQGQTVAIVSDSNINLTDISQFRALFGLPANTPNVIVNGTDPGVLNCNPPTNGDECEAVIDVEWSGSVAKNAQIDLVVSQTTNSSDGIDMSAQYIVDHNLAPILSESYGACEFLLGTTENAFLNTLWMQAATQGITVIASTGDSGSAGCDYDNPNDDTVEQPAQDGLAVSGVSTTPFNVAVGGTDFNQIVNDPTNYWNSTNVSGTENSAIGYIPETTWNDSCTNEVFVSPLGFDSTPEANCNDSALTANIGPIGGGGGVSAC
ncbi:MAG: protease pro-enzyme activation domain-containing protein, partial [Candidatus Acidiferrales bacterium]